MRSNYIYQLLKSKAWFITMFAALMINLSVAQPLSGVLPKYDSYVNISTPSFTWNSLNGAIDYTLILSQDITFSSGVVQSSPLIVQNWTAPSLAFGVWYWKVEANTGLGIQVSDINKFTIYEPSQNANLTLWLKADAGLTLDVSGNVDTWTDLSPNAYQMTQPISTKRPGITTALNGLPALNFTGTQFLNGGDVLDIGTSSRSMFVVGKMAASNQTLFSKSVAALANNRYGLIKDGTQTAFIYQEITSPHIYSAYNNTNYALYSLINNRGIAKNKMTVNNSILGQITISSSHNMNSSYRFLIGAYNNATDNGELLMLNGGISEMVFINTADSAEIKKVENYLRYKYAPPINLGKDSLLNHFCSININAPSGFSSLLWSTGETTPTISVNQQGIYWVQGIDVFGYMSRDTIIIYHPTIPPPTFNGICVNETMTWNADMGPGFTYLWSTGETTPSINITSAGTYSVQVTDAFACSKNSGNYTFGIDTYSQTSYLGNDTTLCAGNLIGLQVGAAETMSYLWPDASTGNNYEVDTTGNYFVEAINGNGCVAQDTIHITISGTAPAANYSFSNVCHETAADFVDLSVPAGADPIATWTWDMGDGNVLTSQDPSHVYITPGTYPVELYVESVGGCGAYFTDTINVYSNPSAAYSFTGHCAEYDIQFTDESVDGSTPISNYLWTFDMPWTGAYDTADISIPEKIFDTAGSYDVFLLVTDGNGCVDSVTQTIVIDPTPQADFTFVDGCENTAILFTNTSVTQPSSTYLYTFPDNTTSILPNTSKVFSSYGLQTVILQVTNTFGCIGSVDHDVAVHPNPSPVMDLGPYCMGTYMESADASTIPLGSIDSSVWIFNTLDTLSGSTVYYLIENLGQQQVVLTTYSDQGCSATLSQFIDVTTSLDVSFTSTGVAAVGDPMAFENTSTGTTVALWNFGDGTFSTVFSPEHVYSATYLDSMVEVYLVALNTTGCADTAFQTISVQRANIDLELTQLYLQKQNDVYIVGVKMKNVGSVKLETIQLNMEMEKGILFSETIIPALLPLDDTIYVFTGKPSSYISEQDETDAFICVNGLGFASDGTVETYLDNNVACKNIEGDNVVLLPIYPNPVSENLTIEILVTVEADLSVKLFDSRGREVRSILPQQTLASGFYTYTINVEDIAEGTYFIRMKSGEGEVMEKVVIGD